MYFLYVFILQFLYNSTRFERPFRSSSGVHNLLYLQLCTNHANVSTDTFAWFVQSWFVCRTPDLALKGMALLRHIPQVPASNTKLKSSDVFYVICLSSNSQCGIVPKIRGRNCVFYLTRRQLLRLYIIW